MPERPTFPLDIEAAIEDARELALKELLTGLPLLFDSQSALPIIPTHMAVPKPAKLKLELRQFATTLFDLEASRYPQYADSSEQLRDWLCALVILIEGEIVKELAPFAALHDFHCSAQERTETIDAVLRERLAYWLKIGDTLLVMNVMRGKMVPKFPISSSPMATEVRVTNAKQIQESSPATPLVPSTGLIRPFARSVYSPIAAQRMKDFMTAHGLTQPDFAEMADTTERTIRSFGNTGKIRKSTLLGIVKAMSTTLEDILKP